MFALGHHSEQKFTGVKEQPDVASLWQLSAWYVLQNALWVAFTLVLKDEVWKELKG